MKGLINDCKENYKEEASSYDQKRFVSRSGKLYDRIQKETIIKWLNDKTRILDVGCGTGRFSITLAKNNHDVTAFDSSQEMLDITKDKAEKEKIKLEIIKGDLFELPFEDKSFDAINCMWVLRHFDDEHVMQAIKEFKRVLKDNGKLVFDAPNSSILKYLQFAKKFQKHNPKTIDRHFDIRKLKKDLIKEGLVLQKIKYLNKLPMFITKIILMLPMFTFMYYLERHLNCGMNALLLFEKVRT